MRKNLLVLLFLIAQTASAQWFTGAGSDGNTQAVNLYDWIKMNPSGITIGTGAIDPKATEVLGEAGSLLLSSLGPYYKLDAGENKNWAEVGLKHRSVHNIHEAGNADYYTGQFNTGNNATFDGGGSLSGTFTSTDNSNDLIDGSWVYKYSSVNVNDYIASEDISVPPGYRGAWMGVNARYRYDGLDNEIEYEAKCTGGASSGNMLTTSGSVVLPAYSVGSKELNAAIYIPNDCDSVRHGFSANTNNLAATFLWDEWQLNNNPFSSLNTELTSTFYSNDILENTLTAAVTDAATPTFVESEGINFISSISRLSGPNRYSISFVSGFFSVAPIAVCSVFNVNAGPICDVSACTTSSCTVNIRDTGGTPQYDDFNIYFRRTGADYVNPRFTVVTPATETCTLYESQTSGTGGGTFTSGSWQTRTLNTTSGDCSWVSLSSNQFTLSPGRYEIEASAPGYKVNSHKAKLRNITDSTDDIIGTSEYCDAGDDTSTSSIIKGSINLVSAKTFEIQHRCGSTFASSGLGVAASFSVSEIYTLVKIKRIK